jgi:F0F1-type ATP synthase membrane subunit c/vacuolar-type H+-ATPase subunit K
MRFTHQVLLVLTFVLVSAAPLFAADEHVTKSETKSEQVIKSPGAGPGIGMGLAIVGIGIGIGLVGFAALSGIARQPEQAGAIQGAMILLAGLVEGAGIIALILCFVLGVA